MNDERVRAGTSLIPVHTDATRLFAAVPAFVAWGAVLLQCALSVQLAVANGRTVLEGILIYLGYFTVLTNLLVALALSAPLVSPRSAVGRFFALPGVATTVAAAITLVGIAYFLLLRNVWEPQGWQLVADVTLHYVTPALFLVYWWVVVPKRGLLWSDIPKGMLYPIGYLIYALVRGALTGMYPYHFIDVEALGFGPVLANATGLLAGFGVVAAVLVVVARFSRAPS